MQCRQVRFAPIQFEISRDRLRLSVLTLAFIVVEVGTALLIRH
jgi:hypothetical protein